MITVEKTIHEGQKISLVRILRDIKKKNQVQALETVLSAIENDVPIEKEKHLESVKSFGVSIETIEFVEEKTTMNHNITFAEAVEIALIMIAVIGIYLFAVLILLIK